MKQARRDGLRAKRSSGTRSRALLVATGLLLAASRAGAGEEPLAPEPSQEDLASAERYAARAFEAYGRKEYRLAADLYQRALRAAPGADLLYNLARIYDLGLQDRTLAIAYYQRYLEHPSSARPRSDYAALRIKELEAAEAVDRERAGADAEGQSASVAPPKPSKVASIPPGVALPRGEAGATLVMDPADAGELWTMQEIAGATIAGAGAAGLAFAAGFAISAQSKGDVWRSDCRGNVCGSEDGVAAARAATERANAATVALVTGGTLLAVGSALFWTSSRPAPAPMRLAVDLGVPASTAGLGLSVSGRF